MTLDEAKVLLSENNIPFELCEFHNEAEYWCRTILFPDAKNAKACKVIAIIIRSNNGKKNIELQFNAVGDVFCFEELWFGDYAFEMFDYNEDMLADDLIRNILEIKQGKLIIIVRNDIRKTQEKHRGRFSVLTKFSEKTRVVAGSHARHLPINLTRRTVPCATRNMV